MEVLRAPPLCLPRPVVARAEELVALDVGRDDDHEHEHEHESSSAAASSSSSRARTRLAAAVVLAAREARLPAATPALVARCLALAPAALPRVLRTLARMRRALRLPHCPGPSPGARASALCPFAAASALGTGPHAPSADHVIRLARALLRLPSLPLPRAEHSNPQHCTHPASSAVAAVLLAIAARARRPNPPSVAARVASVLSCAPSTVAKRYNDLANRLRACLVASHSSSNFSTYNRLQDYNNEVDNHDDDSNGFLDDRDISDNDDFADSSPIVHFSLPWYPPDHLGKIGAVFSKSFYFRLGSVLSDLAELQERV
ncbi:hypothetical protein HDU84_000760 [Entophlyctis sp. JEL0112]|nr:hypothetical protein HDU84_000760 [Entophlyctis sp. JEL0112]